MITCEDALDAAMTLTLLTEGADAMDLWLQYGCFGKVLGRT